MREDRDEASLYLPERGTGGAPSIRIAHLAFAASGYFFLVQPDLALALLLAAIGLVTYGSDPYPPEPAKVPDSQQPNYSF